MPAAIETFGLTKRYGETRVLDDVTAQIPTGQVVGLLGHNGAGKTTFLKLVLGLLRPSVGALRVLESSPRRARRNALHRRIGYLPENVAFYPNLTARETILYLARLKGRPEKEGAALLARVGLFSAAEKRVHTFSKGMRQRLGLAQALLGNPDLFLFDEPTAGLDPTATTQFFHLVRDLRNHGKTILISSHLLAEIEPHLDRALILAHGHVLAQGTLEEMREAVDLPVTVRARVVNDGLCTFGEPELATRVVREEAENGEVAFLVPRGRKLELIRRLLALPGLADISVAEPSLPELYAQISGSAPLPRGGAHG